MRLDSLQLFSDKLSHHTHFVPQVSSPGEDEEDEAPPKRHMMEDASDRSKRANKRVGLRETGQGVA